ncbi:MAG: DNA cytosine methyltransferase [Verrucomicrobiaceae bacterium]
MRARSARCACWATVNELALFAGAGGGLLSSHLLGWKTICAVENDRFASAVLLARQNDGSLPPYPVWDDVRTFDGRAWRGRVDVISGGFPCQDISSAGTGTGISGPRSGLWKEMSRIVGEVRPRFVFAENSPRLQKLGLEVVLRDLAALGYDVEWGVLGASDVGAPHLRKRIWIVAHTHAHGRRRESVGESECGEQSQPWHQPDGLGSGGWRDGPNSAWWQAEPNVGRVVDELASGLDQLLPGHSRIPEDVAPKNTRRARLRAIGNGQVPLAAATAFRILARRGGWL